MLSRISHGTVTLLLISSFFIFHVFDIWSWYNEMANVMSRLLGYVPVPKIFALPCQPVELGLGYLVFFYFRRVTGHEKSTQPLGIAFMTITDAI